MMAYVSYEDAHYAMELAAYEDACERERYVPVAPCPCCFESSGYAERLHPATWWEPAWADADPMRPCPHCDATGYVEADQITLEDLENIAAEEAGQ